jgi:hypothetical protein
VVLHDLVVPTENLYVLLGIYHFFEVVLDNPMFFVVNQHVEAAWNG